MSKEETDFIYRYPFSVEAKSFINGIEAGDNRKYLVLAKSRIEEAIDKGKLEYKEVDMLKNESVVTYAYARILVSTLPPHLIDKYALAEARRSAAAMFSDTEQNIIKITEELGIKINYIKNRFEMDVITFLKSASVLQEYQLVNQKVLNGNVIIEKPELCGLLVSPMFLKIKRGLPIPKNEIPKNILSYANGIKSFDKVEKIDIRNNDWIDALLNNPIPDVRQRAVYLILAPYLVNIKKLDVEEAFNIIHAYIEKCRLIDPHTRITDMQIRYYCNYAKLKGRKPISRKKAEELLNGVINFSS